MTFSGMTPQSSLPYTTSEHLWTARHIPPRGKKNHNPPICPAEENEISSNVNNMSCDGMELANIHLTSLHPPKVYLKNFFLYITSLHLFTKLEP